MKFLEWEHILNRITKRMREAAMKGFIGMFGLMFGYTVSISTTEIWLRLTSLLVGIVVGVLSGYSIWLSIKRKLWEAEQRRLNSKYGLNQEETTTI